MEHKRETPDPETKGDEVQKRYCIRPEFLLREIAGEYVIVPTGDDSPLSHAVLAPNDTAVLLWKTFAEPNTIDAAVSKCMLEYEAAEETIRDSVERFIKESLVYNILEEVD